MAHLRPAIARRLRERASPSFPPTARDAALLGGTVFDLLSRESGFTLPLVVVAMRLQDRTLRLRDPVLLSLIGIAVLHAASIEAIHVFGIGVEPPHEIRFGSDVLDNFLTYAGWTANFLIVRRDNRGDGPLGGDEP